MSEYLQMPPMARVDDYDRCFLDVPEGAKATFCMVTSLIQPNESNHVWQIVNVCKRETKNTKHTFLLIKTKTSKTTTRICITFCKLQIYFLQSYSYHLIDFASQSILFPAYFSCLFIYHEMPIKKIVKYGGNS